MITPTLAPDAADSSLTGMAGHEEEAARPLTAETLAQEYRRVDRLIAAVLIVFSFLLASFPIRNSDIWLQLRTGQMIAQGEFPWGQDPFTYTSSAGWWHTAWLWDLTVYGIYSLLGGAGLVLLRGLLLVAATWLLLQMRQPNGSLLAAVGCLGLAVLAMGQRLLMQSDIASFVLLAVTLYCLWHPPVTTDRPRLKRLLGLTQNRLWVFLPPVFWLWANVDYWFFLGPAAVALALIGDIVHDSLGNRFREDAWRPAERKSLAAVLGLGLVACVLNPNHIHVFQLPTDLASPAMSLLQGQPGLERLGASPFDWNTYLQSGADTPWYQPKGLSLSEWAYYPLVALGLLSFVLNWNRGSWSRFLVWLGFFALSAWTYRAIGFFAVVAGPVTMLNFQDWLLTKGRGSESLSRGKVLAGSLARLAMLLVGLALVVVLLRVDRLMLAGVQDQDRATWSGLVHRRGGLGWSMYRSATLKNCAERMRQWRREGRLVGKTFHFSWVSQPPYWAWFAPEEQWFMDSRLTASDEVVRDYLDVAEALRNTGKGPPERRHEVLRRVFEKYDISHLVIGSNIQVQRSSPGGRRQVREPLLYYLLADRGRDGRHWWELLSYYDGRTYVLAWTGSRHWNQLKQLQYDREQEAYRSPSTLPPPGGPTPPQRKSWLIAWLTGEVVEPPLGIDAASAHLRTLDDESFAAQNQAFRAQLMPLVGWPSGVLAGFPVPMLPGMEAFTPASALLAVRAARSAIAQAVHLPEADSYRSLGLAYWQLYQAYVALEQRERDLAPANPFRDAQQLAALRQAAFFLPDIQDLHIELCLRYLRKRYLDLAWMEYDKALTAAEKRGMNREQFDDQLRKHPRATYRQLPDAIREAQRTYETQMANFRSRLTVATAVDRARLATQLNLVDESRQAMEAVVNDPTGQFDESDVITAFQQLAQLYVQIGYLPEALQLVNRPEALARLGPQTYYQLRGLIFAANGNYEQAVENLVAADLLLQQQALNTALSGMRLETLGGTSEPPGSAYAGITMLYDAAFTTRQRAEQWCQIGLIALEAGWTKGLPDKPDAATCFHKALTQIHARSPLRSLAARYYYLITGRWLSIDIDAGAPEPPSAGEP